MEGKVLPELEKSCLLSREVLRDLMKSYFLVPGSLSFQACTDSASWEIVIHVFIYLFIYFILCSFDFNLI